MLKAAGIVLATIIAAWLGLMVAWTVKYGDSVFVVCAIVTAFNLAFIINVLRDL